MEIEDIYPKWTGKPLIPTRDSATELSYLNLDLDDAILILNEGFDCSRSNRAKNIVERCRQKGNKIIKIVVAEMETHWKLIHAGKFTIREIGGKT